jgi:hypothetical protein
MHFIEYNFSEVEFQVNLDDHCQQNEIDEQTNPETGTL